MWNALHAFPFPSISSSSLLCELCETEWKSKITHMCTQRERERDTNKRQMPNTKWNGKWISVPKDTHTVKWAKNEGQNTYTHSGSQLVGFQYLGWLWNAGLWIPNFQRSLHQCCSTQRRIEKKDAYVWVCDAMNKYAYDC